MLGLKAADGDVYRDKQSRHRPVIDVRASWVRGVVARTCKGSRISIHQLRPQRITTLDYSSKFFFGTTPSQSMTH